MVDQGKGYWRNKLTWPKPMFSSAFPFLIPYIWFTEIVLFVSASISFIIVYEWNEIPGLLYSIDLIPIPQYMLICHRRSILLATGIMFCLHGFLFLSLTFHLLGQTNKCFSHVLCFYSTHTIHGNNMMTWWREHFIWGDTL